MTGAAQPQAGRAGTAQRPAGHRGSARRAVVVLGGLPGPRSAHVHAPDRVLRVWGLLNAEAEELHQVRLPAEALPRLQRTLEMAAGELERSVSPALAAELEHLIHRKNLPSGPDELRVECTALLGWASGLVLGILGRLQEARARQGRGRAGTAADGPDMPGEQRQEGSATPRNRASGSPGGVRG